MKEKTFAVSSEVARAGLADTGAGNWAWLLRQWVERLRLRMASAADLRHDLETSLLKEVVLNRWKSLRLSTIAKDRLSTVESVMQSQLETCWD